MITYLGTHNDVFIIFGISFKEDDLEITDLNDDEI